jgi:hypothetical protein
MFPRRYILPLEGGEPLASFLLGHPSVFNRSVLEAPYTERRPEWSAYLQDDVRVSDRLTLNLGMRWDLFVPYVEDDDRQSNFDTSLGRFVVASDDAGGRHQGLAYLQITEEGPRRARVCA